MQERKNHRKAERKILIDASSANMKITLSFTSGTSYLEETPVLVLMACYNTQKRIKKWQQGEAANLLKISAVMFPPPFYPHVNSPTDKSKIPEIQTHQQWGSIELAMDAKNISKWFSSQHNKDKDAIRVQQNLLANQKYCKSSMIGLR